MHPADCPKWEYEDVPNYKIFLRRQIKNTLVQLRSGKIDTFINVQDTRPIHHHFFHKLTPTHFPYFSGNYRGEDFRCLKFYHVQVRSDPRVGTLPHAVRSSMTQLEHKIREGFAALDFANNLPNARLPIKRKILYTTIFACRIFEAFLTIHPYANGNGHLGRFTIWCILGRYGFWPKKWPIDPRPEDPYIQAIKEYRSGNPALLEQYVLQCIVD